MIDLLMTSLNETTRPKRDTRGGSESEPGANANANTSKRQNFSVGCNTLKMLDTMSDFILDSSSSSSSLQLDFKSDSSSAHPLDCVQLLAQLDSLSEDSKKQIWSDIESTLSEKNMTFVAGRMLSVVQTRALDDLNYDASLPGTLELIGALSSVVYRSNNDESKRLVNKILKDNYASGGGGGGGLGALKNHKSLPVFTRALGKMICDVDYPIFYDLLKHDDMLADIWTMSDTLEDCPMECLIRIAKLTARVYGNHTGWQPSMLTMLGPVAAALPISLIRTYPNITRHFSASAFQRLRFSSNFSNANHDQRYLDSISLTSAMLLLEKDCSRVDGCSFASSLAAAELAPQHSITSRANISHSLPSLGPSSVLIFIFISKWFYAYHLYLPSRV